MHVPVKVLAPVVEAGLREIPLVILTTSFAITHSLFNQLSILLLNTTPLYTEASLAERAYMNSVVIIYESTRFLLDTLSLR